MPMTTPAQKHPGSVLWKTIPDTSLAVVVSHLPSTTYPCMGRWHQVLGRRNDVREEKMSTILGQDEELLLNAWHWAYLIRGEEVMPTEIID